MGGLQNVAYMNNMRNGMSSNGTYGNMGNMGMMSMNSMNMSGSYAPQSAFGMMPQNGEMPSQILQNSNGTFGAVPSENMGDSSRSSQNDYANRPPVLDADTSRQVKSDPGSSNDSNIANYQENNTRSPSVRTNNSAENTDQNMNQKQFNENSNVNSDVVMDEEYEMRKAQYQQVCQIVIYYQLFLKSYSLFLLMSSTRCSFSRFSTCKHWLLRILTKLIIGCLFR